MISQLQILAGTMADDSAVGTVAWLTPNGAKVLNDSSYAISPMNMDDTWHGWDNEVKIVKSDGTIGTTNKADTVNAWHYPPTYIPYGSSSELWNETWTAEDINDIDFGVVLSVKRTDVDTSTTDYSHYLKATNFGFTIPTGATINGILVEINKNTGSGGILVDHIRITVYYTISPFPTFFRV